MKVIFKGSFVRDLKKIRERDLKARVKRVIEAIEQATTLHDIANLKQIRGAQSYYRIRLGDYRIGLRIDGEIITLIRFLHRKDIYRYFP